MSVNVAGREDSRTAFIRRTLLMKVANFALFHPPYTISAQRTQASFSYSYSPWECYKTSFSSSKHTRKMKGKPLLNAIVRLSPESSRCSSAKTGLCWSGGSLSGPWIYSVWGVSFKCDDLPVRVSMKICTLAVVSPQVVDQKVICSLFVTF